MKKKEKKNYQNIKQNIIKRPNGLFFYIVILQKKINFDI